MGDKDTIRDDRVGKCPECGARYPQGTTFCPFDGQPLRAEQWDPFRAPLAGSIVGGRYEVLDALGEGGMGIVYRVRHVGLDRLFAMKALRPELASDKALGARFVQEAKATAAIKHPGVVAINDFGDLDDGTPYLVMELLDGVSLAQRLRNGGPLPPDVAAEVSAKIASALAASHAAGVIHRDLKPENVFLVGKAPAPVEADVRIVDFGAAKMASGTKLTRPGMVFGTPHYMSPEQASGQEVDPRSDVYSLGVLLFEMLTGKVPFEADTYMGVLTKHMFTETPLPSALLPRGESLRGLDAVVQRAMAKDSKARFQSMEAFAEGLRTWRSAPALPMVKGTVRMADAARVLAAPRQPSLADRLERTADRAEGAAVRRKAVLVASLLVALSAVFALGASIVFGVRRARDRQRPVPTAAAPSAIASPMRAVAPPVDSVRSAELPTTPSATTPPAQPPRTIAPMASTAPLPSAARPTPTPPPPPGHDFADPWKR